MLRRAGGYLMPGNRFPRLESEKTSARLKEIQRLLDNNLSKEAAR